MTPCDHDNSGTAAADPAPTHPETQTEPAGRSPALSWNRRIVLSRTWLIAAALIALFLPALFALAIARFIPYNPMAASKTVHTDGFGVIEVEHAGIGSSGRQLVYSTVIPCMSRDMDPQVHVNAPNGYDGEIVMKFPFVDCTIDRSFGFPWRCLSYGVRGEIVVIERGTRKYPLPIQTAEHAIEFSSNIDKAVHRYLPTRIEPLGYLLNTLVFFAAIYASCLGVQTIIRARRREHACEACGYSRHGLPAAARCPECGATWQHAT